MSRKIFSNAKRVAIEKGILKEEESFSDVYGRIAKNIASIEKNKELRDYWKDKFFFIMDNNYFVPNFPVLRNASSEDGEIKATLSACFVLDIEDSRKSIFSVLSDSVETQAMGGGVGYNFSKLRSKGTEVSSTNGHSSGPVSFMKVYDLALGDIIRQGGVRNGASLGSLEVTHPDIMEFIQVKKDENLLNNFNLSVLITDSFMEKVDKEESLDLIDPHSKEVRGSINAAALFDEIAKNAWAQGCPGCLYIDNANKNNPFSKRLHLVNPCSETFLYDKESCTLGSLNMNQIYSDGVTDEQFYDIINTAVRFLDNTIDLNKYPVEGMKEVAQKYRKIGLGFFGIADVLFQEKLAYNSEEGRNYVEGWYAKLSDYANKSSEGLGTEKGSFKAFSSTNFTKSKRNSYVTLQAPTGTISIIGGTTPGMEPVYGLIYYIKTSKDTTMKVINPYLERELKKRKIYSDELITKIEKNDGSIQNLEGIPRDMQEIFVTALDIHWEDHIKMQAVVQKHVDNGVSKTINMHSNASVSDVKNAYKMAHSLGLKGVTVYRNNCKKNQPYSSRRDPKIIEEKPNKKRSSTMYGATEKFDLGECGNLYITINKTKEGNIEEVLINKGNSGSCTAAHVEALGKWVTSALRHGAPIEELIDQAQNIKCDKVSFSFEEGKEKPDKVTSCPMAVALALKRAIRREDPQKLKDIPNSTKERCPMCKEGFMIFEESCERCNLCFYTKC